MAYNKLNSELLKSYDDEKEILNLEEAALRFIHNRCTGLRYDSEVEKKEQTEKINLGTSIGEKQIPYNMQMDIDRLCLENAVKRFLDSGVTIDAFDVYFCFSEMFLGDYRNTGAMVELLSEFENNGSSVLMKHRDHYAHSVYVFVLGLAIYETNNEYRKAYAKTYELDNDTAAAHHFIKYWGTASLFHDIGYPMELPFEQATSYFEVNSHEREKMPFMSYSCMDEYVKISEPLKREISKIDGRIFNTTNELFAGYITKKLAKEYIFNEQDLLEKIADKPTHPEKFNYFMDHAYFSATVILRKLYQELEEESFAELRDSEVTAPNILTKLLRLSQVTGGHLTDDERDTKLHRVVKDLAVQLLRLRAKLEHIAQDRHTLAVARLLHKGVERRDHRVGIGVVAVVDVEDAVLLDAPPARTGKREVLQRRNRLLARRAVALGHGEGEAGVRDVVLARQYAVQRLGHPRLTGVDFDELRLEVGG